MSSYSQHELLSPRRLMQAVARRVNRSVRVYYIKRIIGRLNPFGLHLRMHSMPNPVSAGSTLAVVLYEIFTDLSFYRVTLCVSADFAVARCRSVRPSVRLSRWCIVSTRLKISSNFFLVSVARHSSSLTPSADTPGNAISGDAIYTWWENFCDFRLKSPYI